MAEILGNNHEELNVEPPKDMFGIMNANVQSPEFKELYKLYFKEE